MKYLRRLIRKLARMITRKTVDLEAEIVRLIKDIKSSIGKDDIVKLLEVSYPKTFSKFEIEYTIDRMVCDHKIKTDGYSYTAPVHKKSKKTKIKPGSKEYQMSGKSFD